MEDTGPIRKQNATCKVTNCDKNGGGSTEKKVPKIHHLLKVNVEIYFSLMYLAVGKKIAVNEVSELHLRNLVCIFIALIVLSMYIKIRKELLSTTKNVLLEKLI